MGPVKGLGDRKTAWGGAEPEPWPFRRAHKFKPIKTGLTEVTENRMGERDVHEPESIVSRTRIGALRHLSSPNPGRQAVIDFTKPV